MTDKCGVSLPEITAAHAKRRRFPRRCVTFAAFSLSLSLESRPNPVVYDPSFVLFRHFSPFPRSGNEFSIGITIVITIFIRDGFDGSQSLFKLAI